MLSTKKGGSSGIVYHYKMFLGLTNRFLLAVMGHLIFSKVFVLRGFSGRN